MTPITFRAPRNPNLTVWPHVGADPIEFTNREYETSDPAEIDALRRHPLVTEVTGQADTDDDGSEGDGGDPAAADEAVHDHTPDGE